MLAALLTRSDYGVWGVLVVSLGVLARLKVVGISDKYLQQDEPDQELAFQKAFTLEVLMTAAAIVPLALALPVIAVVYGDWNLVPPGIVLITVLAADALQAPFWIYYRRMNFVRQRALQAIEPIVGFVVADRAGDRRRGLLGAGARAWSLARGRGPSRRSSPRRTGLRGATTERRCGCTLAFRCRSSSRPPAASSSPTRP